MTSSTASVLPGSSSAAGIRYGMWAAAIFFLARVMRAAIVASLTRKLRAISAVVTPHTSRSVNATLAGAESVGWQQVKISRSRSSPKMSSSMSWPVAETVSTISNGSDRRAVDSRRIRSKARFLAAVVSHAPGRAGNAVLRPRDDGFRVGILHAFLGKVEVAGDAHRRREHKGPLAAVRVGERFANDRFRHHAARRRTPPTAAPRRHQLPAAPAWRPRSPRRATRRRSGNSRRVPPSSRRTVRR